MTRLCLCLIWATTACAGGGPPATVWFDGSEYARLTTDGWQHMSGELALQVQGDSVIVRGQAYPIRQIVNCEGDTCESIPIHTAVSLRGDVLSVDGVARGEVRDADSVERLSALAMAGAYVPPGDIDLHARVVSDETGEHTLYQIAATPDGQLVRGEACRWLKACPERPPLGTWSVSSVEVGHWAGSMADSLTTDSDVVNATVNGWTLSMDAEGRVTEATDMRWRHRVSLTGSTGAPRLEDRTTVGPARRALLLALTALVDQQYSSALPPPPPPQQP
jgi:hypothetical protein